MKQFIALFAFLALASVAYAQMQYVGIAYLTQINSSGVSGYVKFTLENGNVSVSVNVTVPGKASTTLGIHVHDFGDLSGTSNGLSAGSHLNYNNESHGCPETSGDARHAGDMGNWEVDADGNIIQTKSLDILELQGASSIIGRAVVVHAGTDDCVNVPSAGSRLAFGVIGIANVANNSAKASLSEDDIRVAVCDLVATSDGPAGLKGRVVFSQMDPYSPLTVTARIEGINERHGFHVHEFGDLSLSNGNSAGTHYNPYNYPHSIPDNADRHMGDMGNILHFENNVGFYTHEFNDKRIMLSGLFNIIGRAVVLHELKDNCSQPLGFAGKRYGICVIGVANMTTPAVDVPAATPTEQDISDCPAAPIPDETSSAVSIIAQIVLLFAMAVVAIVNFH